MPPDTSEAIRGLLTTTGLSGRDLARLTEKSPALISRWVKGSRCPSPADILTLTQQVEMRPEQREALWAARLPTLSAALISEGLSSSERLRAFAWVGLAGGDL